ncbi:hypothetical protein M885DRAFT_539644 [Pelagophyceae sp. CCMP2097]|nr:hypothetical protein M885DRAFT_539644 [Pelagophyceae sp. CCMP2097]
MLLQSSASQWLASKLQPVANGALKVSVRFASGQVSTFAVDSAWTVFELKALISRDVGLDGVELLYLGKRLDDVQTLEACGVVDRACLMERPRPPATKVSAADAQRGLARSGAELYELVKHNPAVGLDVDFHAPAWTASYAPYAAYVPPVGGVASIQAPAYEAHGDQAWRRDYKVDGPGAQALLNNAHALLHAPQETE